MAEGKKINPIRGVTYTLAQILKDLDLPDSPSLRFHHINSFSVIQHAHVTNEQLLAVPGIASSIWRHQYETNEQIPLFMFSSVGSITDFVTIEPIKDSTLLEMGERFWVCPKGHYLDQNS